VCHLKRCLYGLKQSPSEFSMLLRAWLVDNGWQQCVSDPCIYIFRAGHVFAMIALYVDGIPAACNDASWLTSFKARLGARFKIKELGELSQLLGMHITRNRSARTISLDQSKYLRDILAKYGTTDSKPSSLPMDPGSLAGLAHMACPPPYRGGQGRLPQPLGQSPIRGRLHAPRCFHGVEHLWLSPSIPHGRSHACREEGTPVPPWHHPHAHDLRGGGGTDQSLKLTCFADTD
jgi:hypothetical protein